MKIIKSIEIEQAVEIDIDSADILEAISGDSDSPNAAYCLVKKCATVLNAVSDEIIALMPDNNRKTIAKYLDKQAERYMTDNV
jgi:predicted PP-loop superfamily ATPase